MIRKKLSLQNRFALAEARVAEELAKLERSHDPQKGSAVASRAEDATRRLLAQIQDLRRAALRSRTQTPTPTRLHDLEPVVHLLEELKRERSSRRDDLEAQIRNADEWEKNAMRAVHVQDDGLAREALGWRRECLVRAARVKHDLEVIESSIAMFEPIIDALRGGPDDVGS